MLSILNPDTPSRHLGVPREVARRIQRLARWRGHRVDGSFYTLRL